MANVFGQMKDMYKLQKEAKEMQRKLRERKVTGESSHGEVKIYMNAAQELEDLQISKDILRSDNHDLIVRFFKDAFKDYQKKLQKEMAKDFDMDQLKRMMGN